LEEKRILSLYSSIISTHGETSQSALQDGAKSKNTATKAASVIKKLFNKPLYMH
jgi:hypothetical protein